MHQTIKAWTLLAVCSGLAGCGGAPKYPNLSAADRAIVAEIEKLGGEVTLEKSGQGEAKIVVEVDLSINLGSCPTTWRTGAKGVARVDWSCSGFCDAE